MLLSVWRAWGHGRRNVTVAAAVAVFALVGAAIAPPGRTHLDVAGYALLLGGAFALVARRRHPVAVLLVTTACVFGYLVRGYPGVAAALPVMVALLTAVRAGHRLVAVAPKAALLLVAVTDLTLHHGGPVRQVLQDRFLLAGWLVASAGAGVAFRQWDAYLREARQRVAEAERTREEAALRRAGEERLRIARELHDSLTHSISIVKVQAGVAVHLARKRGEEVPPALLAIQEAGGEAMRELRATLEVLRDPEGEPGEADGGLGRLPELVRRARSAGLPVTVVVDGPRRPLPPAADRAAYRIVQEALTNVARHAGPATASVRVGYGADLLTLRIDDDGRGVPGASPEPGMGLTGMRERVAALGGRLRTGPRPGGGFSVEAEIPLPAPDGEVIGARRRERAGPGGGTGRGPGDATPSGQNGGTAGARRHDAAGGPRGDAFETPHAGVAGASHAVAAGASGEDPAGGPRDGAAGVPDDATAGAGREAAADRPRAVPAAVTTDLAARPAGETR